MRRLVYLILFCALTGCADKHPAPIQATGNAIARVRTHLGSATYHVNKIIPQAQGDSKVHAESVKVEIEAADKSAEDAEHSNDRTAALVAAKDATINRLKSSWSYKIGSFIVGSIALIVGTWVVLGLLGSLVPYGWGRTILNMLPFSNPFNWIYNRRTAPAVQVLTGGADGPA